MASAQGSIYCVVVEPGKHAEALNVEFVYNFSNKKEEKDARSHAQFETLKKIIGTDMGEFLSYPFSATGQHPDIYVLGDEDGRIRKDAKHNRNNYYGIVIVVGRGPQWGDMKSLTVQQAREVVSVMNDDMPHLPLEDGNRRRK